MTHFGLGFIDELAAAVDLTYQTSTQSATDASSYSFASQAIGTAAADRYVIVGIGITSGVAGPRTVSTCTVGGISASRILRVENATGDITAELWMALVPTGTTATVAFTTDDTCARVGISVWSKTGGASPGTAFDTGSSTSEPASISMDIPARGAVVGFAQLNSPGITTWSNITSRYVTVEEAASYHSGADLEYAAAQTGLAIGLSDTSTPSVAVVVASFG